jgi:DNA replication protein DnaC
MLIQPLLDKLVALKLSGMKEALSDQLNNPHYGECSFEERLGLLVDHELTLRDERRLKRRLKKARFGGNAVLADVDMSAARGLDRSLLLSLSRGDWIRQHLNIIITGATGVGKTYLASALGYCACEQDFSVRYYRTSRLLNDIAASHADGTWGKRLDRLARVRLLILDDWLRDRLTPDQLRNMLEIFDDRWQKGATILISQVPIGQWHERMGEPTLADAVLDRMVHNSYSINMKGDSRRKQLAKEKKKKMEEIQVQGGKNK